MTYRLRNILLAVVLAVLAAFLTALYVASYQNRVDEGQELVRVFVAKMDIPPGTPAGSLKDKLTQKEVQKRNVAPAVVYDTRTLEGKTSTQWIYSGEQVSDRRFSATDRSGIHAQLKGNQRAVAFSGNEQQLLAGIVKTGDHVDVLVNFKVGSNGANISRVLLRDVEVLKAPLGGGVNSKLAQTSADQGAFSVVLKLTDSQAHKFFLVSAGNEDHEWWLNLRAPGDATDSPESVTSVPSAVRDGLARNQASTTGGN
jgi:Flp pilus assembly protein CpaB